MNEEDYMDHQSHPEPCWKTRYNALLWLVWKMVDGEMPLPHFTKAVKVQYPKERIG